MTLHDCTNSSIGKLPFNYLVLEARIVIDFRLLSSPLWHYNCQRID